MRNNVTFSKTIIQRFRFASIYFFCAVCLFFIEIGIAVSGSTGVIRTHVGDILVIPLIYCALRAGINLSATALTLAVVFLAILIEIGQGVGFFERMGMLEPPLARTVLGAVFDWLDIVMYTVGGAMILLVEWGVRARSPQPGACRG